MLYKTTKNPAQNLNRASWIDGGKGEDRTLDTWFFSELLPAFRPARQTSGGSPHYYGVQTISSTQLSGQACSRYGFFEQRASEPSLGIVLPDNLEVGLPPI